ncbi:hypothetical protein E8D34_04360 [Nocardioides sp. GY 10113]|uniref:AzlC family ABC transporter permease n=1 Tax=Nocardioides sp. GY 10113 TaxID=2569761 RepID=UPI0010A79DFD|nr:AzlC family ABC transporter permease [Nocardioides sp. GY 10113]TIC88889.1 hypothetical protein E8D34_04360 [Nocardioides sp. GY 10113]
MTTSAVAAPAAVPADLAPPASPVRQAVKDTWPFAAALVPFGLALGTASMAAGLSVAEAMFGAVVLLAGAAQLAVVESFGRGDGIAGVVLVTALVNLRFVYYGAGAARWFSEAPLLRRMLLVFPLVDQTFLLGQQRFGPGVALGWRQRYYLTATAMLAAIFLGSQLVAYAAGARLPEELGLHLAAPLVFAGMLANNLDKAPARIAAVVAGAGILAGSGWLGAATLPVAVGLGVAVAARAGKGWAR